jgi:hypothetical protein
MNLIISFVCAFAVAARQWLRSTASRLQAYQLKINCFAWLQLLCLLQLHWLAAANLLVGCCSCSQLFITEPLFFTKPRYD